MMWRSIDEAGSTGSTADNKQAGTPKTTTEILNGPNVIITSSEAGQGNSSASTTTSGN